MAVAQLWRVRQASATQTDLDRWVRQMQRITISLRAGPTVVLAEVQKKLGHADAAQVNLLKLPILYPEKKSLAACALFRCGNIMDDSDARENAVLVWRELIRDYPTSQYAEFAKGKL